MPAKKPKAVPGNDVEVIGLLKLVFADLGRKDFVILISGAIIGVILGGLFLLSFIRNFFNDIKSIDTIKQDVKYISNEFNGLDNKVEVKMEVMNDRLELIKDQ